MVRKIKESVATHPCKRCGVPLHYKRMTKGKHAGWLYRVLFCDTCLKERRRELLSQRRTPEMYDSFRKHFDRVCITCRKSFSVKGLNNSGTAKTCSDECLRIFKKNQAEKIHLAEKARQAWPGWDKTFGREQTAELCKIGPQHPNAKKAWLISPDGNEYYAVNIADFVRNHEYLFNRIDVVWKAYRKSLAFPGAISPAIGLKNCHATSGLRNISTGFRKSWKGWKCKTLL